jgi:hypothetical protein
MYKLTVSCYYWPAREGRLRLRNLTINELERTASFEDRFRLGRQTSVAELVSSVERRKGRRLRTRCDAELAADLSILDTEAQNSDDSLLLFGTTRDLSAGGIGLVLPSIAIDERYCGQSKRLTVSLYLPGSVVGMEIDPVRCEPLDVADPGQGYFVGAKIVNVSNHQEALDQFLDKLGDVRTRG